MSGFSVVLGLATTADALVAALALGGSTFLLDRHSHPKRLGMANVVITAGTVCAVFAAKAGVLRLVGLDFFGVLHLAYLDLAVVVPLLGALTLVAKRRGVPGLGRPRVTGPVVVAACIALAAAPISVYASFVEPYRLQLEETSVAVPGFSPTRGDLRVAVLADLQFSRVGEHERRAVSMASDLGADLVVIPGDVFQGDDSAFRRQEQEIRALLARLDAPGGVYLVAGNCDSEPHLQRAVRDTSIVYLQNDVVRAVVRGLSIAIGGLGCSYDSPAARRAVERLRAQADTTDICLLIAHHPDVVLKLEHDSGIDLVIAGHTHGGQVRVPGLGPLITLSHLPREAAGGGLSTVNGTRLYVSRGVGLERGQAPRLRLFCPPEVSLLRLTHR